MARTVTAIQQEIFNSIANNPDLTDLNSTSKTAIYRLFVFVVSYAIMVLELLFEQKEKEIIAAINTQKRGNAPWYKDMALKFQYGFELIYDTDTFANLDATQEVIEASKIIKYCSIKPSSETSTLIVKVASESGDSLEPLTDDEKESFLAYMEEIKYEGVKLRVVNNPADKLLLNMQIFRDVLVLDDQGNSKKNGGQPVETAINEYMKALPFDGELVLNDLIEHLRAVDGVSNANIIVATSKKYDVITHAYGEFEPINVRTIPESGYFEIENFNSVVYVV
ncbi:nucleotidyltransferase [Flavobacterium sp. HMWF030]|nr:nucleotidyltransferase [Flavobacterium sp. HMWF030]